MRSGELSRIYEVISQINQLIVHAKMEAIPKVPAASRWRPGSFRWHGSFVNDEEQVVTPACWYGVEEGYLSKIKKI